MVAAEISDRTPHALAPSIRQLLVNALEAVPARSAVGLAWRIRATR